MIRIKNITKNYGDLQVLKGIDLTVKGKRDCYDCRRQRMLGKAPYYILSEHWIFRTPVAMVR